MYIGLLDTPCVQALSKQKTKNQQYQEVEARHDIGIDL